MSTGPSPEDRVRRLRWQAERAAPGPCDEADGYRGRRREGTRAERRLLRRGPTQQDRRGAPANPLIVRATTLVPGGPAPPPDAKRCEAGHDFARAAAATQAERTGTRLRRAATSRRVTAGEPALGPIRAARRRECTTPRLGRRAGHFVGVNTNKRTVSGCHARTRVRTTPSGNGLRRQSRWPRTLTAEPHGWSRCANRKDPARARSIRRAEPGRVERGGLDPRFVRRSGADDFFFLTHRGGGIAWTRRSSRRRLWQGGARPAGSG